MRVLWSHLCDDDDDDGQAWHRVPLISLSPGTLHQRTVWGSANLHDTGKRFTPALLSTRSFQEGATDRLRCSRSVWAEWSDSERTRREGEARRGAGEGKRKAGETETRQSGRRRERLGESDGRVEELAKLSLTAMGPLDNPGILSEINLSPWSCWACHYDVVLALSQWQFVQCFPSSPYYSAVQRSLPSINLCLPVWLSLCVNQLSTLSATVVLLSRWPAQEQVADDQNKCSVARTSVTSLNPLIRCWDISLKTFDLLVALEEKLDDL